MKERNSFPERYIILADDSDAMICVWACSECCWTDRLAASRMEAFRRFDQHDCSNYGPAASAA